MESTIPLRIAVLATNGLSSLACMETLTKRNIMPVHLRYHDLAEHPSEAAVKESVTEQLRNVDHVILPGNDWDVDPTLYGKRPERQTHVHHDIRRKMFEREVIRQANEKGIPLFGICGGMQQMAVYYGSELTQHLENHDQRVFSPSVPVSEKTHSVSFVKNTQLAAISRKRRQWVNSLHHQYVTSSTEHMRITARSYDGHAEAVEATAPAKAPTWGTQFHPEFLGSDGFSKRIFDTVIDGARTHAGKAVFLKELLSRGEPKMAGASRS